MRFPKFSKGSRREWLPLAGFIVILLGTATTAGQSLYRNHVVERADALTKKGYFGLAADLIEPHEAALTHSLDGCRILSISYFGSRRLDRLESATEACLENQQQSTDVIIGLAAAFEMTGRVDQAILLLQNSSAAFKNTAEFPHRLGMIYRNQKNIDGAIAQYLEANRRAPALHKLGLDYVVFMAENQKWNEAAAVADSLKDAKTEDPEVRLLLARVYQRAGRPEAAQAQVEVARSLLEKAPERRDPLLKAYGDLLPSVQRTLAKEPTQRVKNSTSP